MNQVSFTLVCLLVSHSAFAQVSNKTDALSGSHSKLHTGTTVIGEAGAAYLLFTQSLELNPGQRAALNLLESQAKEAKRIWIYYSKLPTRAALEIAAIPEIHYTWPSVGDPQWQEYRRTGKIMKNVPFVNNHPEIAQSALANGNFFETAELKAKATNIARENYYKACEKVVNTKIQFLKELTVFQKGIRFVRKAGGILLLIDATSKVYYWSSTGEAPSPIPFNDAVAELFRDSQE